MANKLRDAAKEALWRDVLSHFTASGLGVRAFCRRENLSEPSFYAWRRELARRTPAERASAAPRPSPARPGKSKLARRLPPPAFVPAVIHDRDRPSGALTLELAGGRVLRLPETFSMARLAELLAALEAASHVSHASSRVPEAAR